MKVWTDTDRKLKGIYDLNVLVVIDMQKDFIDGVFGTPEAKAIVDNVCKKIEEYKHVVERNNRKSIFATKDTHYKNSYVASTENDLPEHCIFGTEGEEFDDKIEEAFRSYGLKLFNVNLVLKHTFGSVELGEGVKKFFNESIEDLRSQGVPSNHINETIEVVGLCTDICVISNVLLLKAFVPSATIIVRSDCCAGTTPENHQKALDIMKQNGIYVE